MPDWDDVHHEAAWFSTDEQEDELDDDYVPGPERRHRNKPRPGSCYDCGGAGCFPHPEGWASTFGYKWDNRGDGLWRFCVKFQNWKAAKGMSEKVLQEHGFDTVAYRRKNPQQRYDHLIFGNHMSTAMMDPNPKRFDRLGGHDANGPPPTPSRSPSPSALNDARPRNGAKRSRASDASRNGRRGKRRAGSDWLDDSADEDTGSHISRSPAPSPALDSVVDDQEDQPKSPLQAPSDPTLGSPPPLPPAAHDAGHKDERGKRPVGRGGLDDHPGEGANSNGSGGSRAPSWKIDNALGDPVDDGPIPPAWPHHLPSDSILRLPLSPPAHETAARPFVHQPVASASSPPLVEQHQPLAEVTRPKASASSASTQPQLHSAAPSSPPPLKPVIDREDVEISDDRDDFFILLDYVPAPPQAEEPRAQPHLPSTTAAGQPSASSSSVPADTDTPPTTLERNPSASRPLRSRLLFEQPAQGGSAKAEIKPGAFWHPSGSFNAIEDPVLDVVRATDGDVNLFTAKGKNVFWGMPGSRGRISPSESGLPKLDAVRTQSVFPGMEDLPIPAVHTIHIVTVTRDAVNLPVIAIGDSEVVVISIRLQNWISFHPKFDDPSAPNPYSQHSFKKGKEYHLVFTKDPSVERSPSSQRPPPSYMVDHLIRTIVDIYRHSWVVKIVLVGYEKWPPGWFRNLERNQGVPAYCAKVFWSHLREATRDHNAQFSYQTTEMLSLQTTEEYEAKYWGRRCPHGFGAVTGKFSREKKVRWQGLARRR